MGRDDAVAALVDALEHGPSLIVIEGDAGVGKTRLLQECLAGRRVLVVACPPLREPFPFGAVVEGLNRLRDRVGDVPMGPLAGALHSMLPEWASVLPPALPELEDVRETRHRTVRALTELVGRLGVEAVVVEDAHWADEATLEWLLTLCAPGDLTAGPGVSVVVTYRPFDLPAESLVRRLTSRSPAGMRRVRIELKPFTAEQTRQLVAALFELDTVSEVFAGHLHERTGGLPLAVQETVLLFKERHDVIRRGGSWARRVIEKLHVPATVRDSVLERLGRLDPYARVVLEAAAVLAEPAGEELLAAVAGLDLVVARPGIRAAQAAGLLQEPSADRLVIRHALDALAIYDGIPAGEARRMHRRAAERLRQCDPAPVVRLSRHTRAAGDTEAWCGYADASAELALQAGDDRTVVALLLEVLTSVEHPAQRRARLARKLGETVAFGASQLGELRGQAADALRGVLAPADLDPGDLGEIRLLLGRVLFQLNDFGAGHAELRTAVDELADRPASAAQAMVLLAQPGLHDQPASASLTWLERAGELFPQIESPAQRLAFLADKATILLDLDLDAGWLAAAEFPSSAPTVPEQRQIARGQLNIASREIGWGRYDNARRRLAAATDLIRSIGYARGMEFATYNQIRLDWYTGNWDGLAETMMALAESDDVAAQIRRETRTLHALLDFVRGDRADGKRRLLDVLDERAGSGRPSPADGVPAALGRLYLADGAASAALELTRSPMEFVVEKDEWLSATDLAPVHVEVLIRAGWLDRAETLVRQFTAGLRGRDAPAAAAALMACRALVAEARGDRHTAAGLFADAATAWAALPRPYDELLTREQHGRCLLAADRRDRGLAVLSEAQQRMQQLGARWDADRLAQLLRQHGVEVARAWRGGRRGYGDQLSPREREVVTLVARGMTNRQIAEALFLSPKTVGRHLQSAMSKLGVSSRTAVAVAAADSGLLRPGSPPSC